MTRTRFHKGSIKQVVFNFIKSKKSVTLIELKKEFPRLNYNTLRGILSALTTSGMVSHHLVWDYNE